MLNFQTHIFFKKFLLSFVILLLSIANSFSQDCKNNNFFNSYHSVGEPLSGSYITILPDSTIFLSGLGLRKTNIQKIDFAGNTKWSKQYVPESAYAFNSAKTLVDYDGNVLHVTNEDYFIKMDLNGQVLSAKKISTKFPFVDLVLLGNGDKIILFMSTADMAMCVARIDKDLNTIKWCKIYNHFFGYGGSMLVRNNKLYIAGNGMVFNYPRDYYPGILCMDLDKGNNEWFKFYSKEKDHYEESLNFQNLYSCEKGFLVKGYMWYGGLEGDHFYMRFDSSFNITRSKKIQYSDSYLSSHSLVLLPQDDGSILKVTNNNVSLSFIDKYDSIKWKKKLPNILWSNPRSIVKNGNDIFIGGYDAFNNVATNTSEYITFIFKSKLPLDSDYCYQVPPKMYTLETLNCEEKKDSITGQTIDDYKYITIKEYKKLTVKNVFPEEGKGCRSSVCNSIKLSGNTQVCNGNQTTIKYKKNEECYDTVAFKFSSLDVKIKSKTDSTVTLTFSNGGNFKVYAFTQSSCDLARDSLSVYVGETNSLHLGNDTTLCKGEKILLHAGSNFTEYRWQDGSHDSTFKVTAPGKYFVSVKDYCANIFTDTILVKQSDIASVDIVSDTFKCSFDTIQIKASAALHNYQWTPQKDITVNASGADFYPTQTTSYQVKAETNDECVVYDTIHIEVKHSPAINLGADTSLCIHDSLALHAGAGFNNYSWNTGSKEESITITQKGNYFIRALASNGCFSSDTVTIIEIFSLPEIHLINDTLLCKNSSIVIDAGAGFKDYIWQDGSKSQSFIASAVGVYKVIIKDVNGCSNTDSMVVKSILPLPSNFLKSDTVKCYSDIITLSSLKNFPAYKWSDGSVNSSIQITEAGVYWLEATDSNHCSNKEFITVSNKDCLDYIYFPSAFTPNNDGINDSFRPKVSGRLEEFELIIYNRFGEMIFKTNDFSKGWNGHIKNGISSNSTYVWFAKYRFYDKPLSTNKGTITVIK